MKTIPKIEINKIKGRHKAVLDKIQAIVNKDVFAMPVELGQVVIHYKIPGTKKNPAPIGGTEAPLNPTFSGEEK